jgi:hypothetical protein
MYAINHAATALLLKRRFPQARLWPLLVSVQAVELLWCALVWAGIEHVSFRDHRLALDFLPYSHSLGSGAVLGLLAAFIYRAPRSAQIAVALGVLSHVLLDVLHHEPDIALLPLPGGPRLGLSLMDSPVLDLVVETGFGVLCWRVYRGSKALLVGILLFNLANLPTMLQLGFLTGLVADHPSLLPGFILAQIVATWVFVAWAASKTDVASARART